MIKLSKTQVGNRLKRIRLDSNLAIIQFAEMIGETVETYSKVESGSVLPTIPQLILIHEKYDVSIDWILYGTIDLSMHFEQARFGRLGPDMKEMFNNLLEDESLAHMILSHYYYLQTKGRLAAGKENEKTCQDSDEDHAS